MESDNWKGLLDASRIPPACVPLQMLAAFGEESEDCLFLNVFRPSVHLEVISKLCTYSKIIKYVRQMRLLSPLLSLSTEEASPSEVLSSRDSQICPTTLSLVVLLWSASNIG